MELQGLYFQVVFPSVDVLVVILAGSRSKMPYLEGPIIYDRRILGILWKRIAALCIFVPKD